MLFDWKTFIFKDYAYAPRVEKKLKLKKKEEGQDFSKLFGVAGHDFPIYHEFPETSFDCASVPVHPGMYADVETACQVRKTENSKKPFESLNVEISQHFA